MATSAQVLGSFARVKIPARWAEQYHRLCDERDKLLNRDCSAVETFQPKLDDMADAASQESERCLSLVAATATHDTIKEVLDAIRRIERGTYGVCEITGEPIAGERLNSIPWARYSIQGQQQIEQGGFGRRTALPTLQGIGGTDTEENEDENEAD
jgi:RNA polymerase-binding transcription factor DksA